MGTIEINGQPVLEGAIVMPLRGNWRADLMAGTDQDITGTVAIDDDGVIYNGTVVRGGVDHTRWNGRVVGGKAKLDQPVLPRAYREATAGLVLADLMLETGEILAPDSDVAVLTYALPQWFRFGNLEDAIEDLVVEKIKANWRIKRNGQIWVGTDTYPTLSVENVIERKEDERSVWTVATERTELEPGVTFEGRKIVQVTHRIGSDLRSEVSLG